MNTDEYEQTDKHSVLSDEGPDSKHSKRGRLKDALNRTRAKLQHAREEREARKQSQDQTQTDAALSDDVNDFLAAGRPSFASSSRPSFGSSTIPPSDTSSNHYDQSSASPRPSTSDSTSQPSPRRVIPPAIPRIDVSASSRFPNARRIDQGTPTTLFSRPMSQGSSSTLLKPEYKVRSQSTSSIASKEGRARRRGLSVGFADAAPVIIGEGGDEAQAPPVEISRAKARARSASPQGRSPVSLVGVQQTDTRRLVPSRGNSNIASDSFIPRQLPRMQTGTLSEPPQRSPRGPHDDDFIPASFTRTPTGFGGYGPTTQAQKPSLPTRTNQVFQEIAPLETGQFDLTREFEMTLGLKSSNHDNPAASKLQAQQSLELAAPKPQRAPPSYDLLESGDRSMNMVSNDESENTRSEDMRPTPQSSSSYVDTQAQNRPISIQQSNSVPTLENNIMVRDPSLSNQPPSNPQEYYPPPPQRQSTTVRKHIHNLEPIHQRLQTTQEQSNAALAQEVPASSVKVPLQLVTEIPDHHRSFAERQRGTSRFPEMQPDAPAGSHNVRNITSQAYEQSPNSYHSNSKDATPQTATSATPARIRFYENARQGNPPEGFI